MAREPREDLVLELLKANWNDANTFSLTPKLSFGWFDEDQSIAQATVPQPDENPVGGGVTGFSGIDPSGGGPTQQFAGTVNVHLWARHDDVSSATGAGQNPRAYLAYAAEEVSRIVGNNEVEPVNPDTNNQPVEYIAYLGQSPAHDTQRTPTVFHLVCPVGYGYGPT